MYISFVIFALFLVVAFIVLFFYQDYVKSLFKSKTIYIEGELEKIKKNNFKEVKISLLPTETKNIISNMIFEIGLPVYGIYIKEGVVYILFLFVEKQEKSINEFCEKLCRFLNKKQRELKDIKIIIPTDNKKEVLKNISKKPLHIQKTFNQIAFFI